MAGRRNYSEDRNDDDDDEGPGTLTAILAEPHFPIGHILLQDRHLFEPLGIIDPLKQRLGKGSFGAAYEVDIGGKKSVIKLTRDPTEAQASAFLCGKSDKHVVDIYKTWSLNWTHEKDLRGWYAVHRAYMHPLSKRDKKCMYILYVLYDDMDLDLKFPKPTHRAMLDKWRGYIREELEEQDMYTQPMFQRTVQVLIETSACVHALHALGIDWEDIHEGNMMRRADGTMVIADVGYGLFHDESTKVTVEDLDEARVREYLAQCAA